jgi:hypothetical protein
MPTNGRGQPPDKTTTTTTTTYCTEKFVPTREKYAGMDLPLQIHKGAPQVHLCWMDLTHSFNMVNHTKEEEVDFSTRSHDYSNPESTSKGKETLDPQGFSPYRET